MIENMREWRRGRVKGKKEMFGKKVMEGDERD